MSPLLKKKEKPSLHDHVTLREVRIQPSLDPGE
jgi:hypothetical protein